jgi:hypothetical protein
MNIKVIATIILAIILAVLLPFGLWHFLLTFTGSIKESHAWYGFWSGFAGDLTIFAGIVFWYRKHACHDHACLRLGKHELANGEFVVCRKHYRQATDTHPDQKITIQHIAKIHNSQE